MAYILYPLIPNVLLLRWSESELAIIENMNTSILNLDHHVRPASIVRFLKGFIQKTISILRVKTGINMQRYVSDVNTSNKDLIGIE